MQIWGQLKSWLRDDWAGAHLPTADVALREAQLWRAQLVHGLLLAVVIAGPFALAFSAYGAYLRGHTALVIGYALAYLIVLVFAFWRKVPYVTQVLGVLGLLYLLGLADLLVFGWKEDARLFFLSLCLLASLFYGVYQGFMALGLSMLTILTVGMLGVTGVLTLPPLTEPFLIGVTPISLVSDTVSLAMLSTMLIIVQRYLVPRFLAAVVESRQRVALLELQQGETETRARGIQQVNYALQRRVFLLEGTAAFSAEATSLLALSPLLSRATEAFARIFDLHHVGLYLPDADNINLVLRASSSEVGQRLLRDAFEVPVNETLVGRVWQSRQPQILTPKDPQELWRLREARSTVLLPLLYEDQILGVLDLQSLEDEAFDADDLHVLKLPARQLAVALLNARRVNEEAALLEATSPLYRLAQRFAKAWTDQEVYTAILDSVQEISPQRAFIMTLSEDAMRATLAAELRGEQLRFPDLQHSMAHWFAEEALIPAVLRARQALLIPDVADPALVSIDSAERESLKQLAARGSLRSLALVPFHAEGRLLGVLGIVFHTLHEFTAAEETLFDMLMEFSGAALQRLQLMRTARRRVEMEQQLRGFSDQLADIFDLQLLASSAASALQTLVDADGVLVSLTPLATPGEEEL
ncbi:MAG: GAF domain-containing protein [Anaerolineae bacterium]|jgi:GAF domain-containing protein|nr:GAF domain-containing protein [Anaerolineae bacterium]